MGLCVKERCMEGKGSKDRGRKGALKVMEGDEARLRKERSDGHPREGGGGGGAEGR